MTDLELVTSQLTEARDVLDRFLANPDSVAAIAQAAALMRDAVQGGGKILSCGNGGSMCDAMHFAEELTGRFRNDRPAIPAIAISDASHLSCVGNDYGYEQVFSRYIEALGRPGDVLLAISTSGNSANVLRAAETARKNRMKVVGLTGKDGGKMAALCDVEIRVPHLGYADRVQEIHIKVIHTLILLLEKGLAV